MRASITSVVVAIVSIVTSACGDRGDKPRAPSTLETGIARDLSQRLGVAVEVTCTRMIERCTARLPDRTELPVRLARTQGGWDWQIDGLLVITDPLVGYLNDQLATLGAPQQVACDPRIRRIAPGERIECTLEHGGRAFVVVHADGTTRIELAIDAAVGSARSEHVTTTRDLELVKMSRELGGEAPEDLTRSGPEDAGAHEDE